MNAKKLSLPVLSSCRHGTLPHLKRTILILALPALIACAGAAEARLAPLFPGIVPVCTPEDLRQVSLPNTTIDAATIDPTDGSCRVTATVTHPPAGDRVKVFIALPMKGWNGRFRGTGGSGLSGGNPNNLRGPVAQGYATGATDTGHEGGSGSFALDPQGRLDWQAIQDNAYVGIHEMTVVGKALAKAFYGRAPGRSYFVGTSTGGRQGLSEAQRYPEDYDGIVASCPAINWHNFQFSHHWPQVVMLAAGNFLPKAKLDAATAAAVAACDALDGVTDGVIDDPIHCTYDPRALVGTKVGDSLFSEADADVIRKIWEGPRTRDGVFMWYGLARGSELSATAGTAATTGGALTGKPFAISLDYIRYFLLQDPKWDWTTGTPAQYEQLWRQSGEQYRAVIGTDNPDLAPFRDRGGKLILLHGLADQLIPPAGTINYYQRMQQQMGGAETTARFARLFLVPGVDHGFHGAGPTPTGQVDAIVRWVEEGRAPEKLIAELQDQDGRTIRTRPLFPYPQSAKYQGHGSTDEAENFTPSSPVP